MLPLNGYAHILDNGMAPSGVQTLGGGSQMLPANALGMFGPRRAMVQGAGAMDYGMQPGMHMGGGYGAPSPFYRGPPMGAGNYAQSVVPSGMGRHNALAFWQNAHPAFAGGYNAY